MAPIYEKLAKRFAKIDSVVIAKMDGTENEHPDVEAQVNDAACVCYCCSVRESLCRLEVCLVISAGGGCPGGWRRMHALLLLCVVS